MNINILQYNQRHNSKRGIVPLIIGEQKLKTLTLLTFAIAITQVRYNNTVLKNLHYAILTYVVIKSFSCSDVETSLLYLVLDIAASLIPQIA